MHRITERPRQWLRQAGRTVLRARVDELTEKDGTPETSATGMERRAQLEIIHSYGWKTSGALCC